MVTREVWSLAQAPGAPQALKGLGQAKAHGAQSARLKNLTASTKTSQFQIVIPVETPQSAPLHVHVHLHSLLKWQSLDVGMEAGCPKWAAPAIGGAVLQLGLDDASPRQHPQAAILAFLHHVLSSDYINPCLMKHLFLFLFLSLAAIILLFL